MNEPESSAQDVVLLDRALAGDEHSFGVIFDRHHARVYRHALRFVRAPESAEDIMAMVFLEAWRKRKTIHAVEGSILPWLLVTTNNVARNLSRSERRYASLLARLPESTHVPDPAPDIVHELAHTAHRRELHEAFVRLSQRDQDILTLCVLEELSTSEASGLLQVPQGTVKSRLARAKARLADMVPHLAVAAGISSEGKAQ